MTRTTTEMQMNVWNDDEGVHIIVSQDADSLGLVYVRTGNAKAEEYWGKMQLNVCPDIARALAAAMIAVADDIEKGTK